VRLANGSDSTTSRGIRQRAAGPPQRQPVEPAVPPSGSDTSCPITGSSKPSTSSTAVRTTRVSTACTPGSAASRPSRYSGARSTLREHLGEAVALVDTRWWFRRQRVDGRERHHQHADAGRHHERDRQHLAAHPPQVAQQLAVSSAASPRSSRGAAPLEIARFTWRSGRRA
jgi:hypothetical protein